MKAIVLKFMLVALALFAAPAAFAQVAVVVAANSPVGTLTKDQVSAVFLGSSPTLPGGGAAALFDLPESNATREQFYQKVAGKSASQVKAVWSRLVFSGKATPPKEAPSSADVKKAVAGSPNAIGYIEKSAVDSTVKVVLDLP